MAYWDGAHSASMLCAVGWGDITERQAAFNFLHLVLNITHLKCGNYGFRRVRSLSQNFLDCYTLVAPVDNSGYSYKGRWHYYHFKLKSFLIGSLYRSFLSIGFYWSDHIEIQGIRWGTHGEQTYLVDRYKCFFSIGTNLNFIILRIYSMWSLVFA